MNRPHRSRCALLGAAGILGPAPRIRRPRRAPRISQAICSRGSIRRIRIVVLDVRTPAEFAAGHVPGARNVSHDQLATRLGELDAFATRRSCSIAAAAAARSWPRTCCARPASRSCCTSRATISRGKPNKRLLERESH